MRVVVAGVVIAALVGGLEAGAAPRTPPLVAAPTAPVVGATEGSGSGSAEDCRFTAIAPLDFALAGATTSVVWLASGSDRCTKTLAGRRLVLTKAADGGRIAGTTNAPAASCNGCALELILDNVPDTAQTAAEWTVKAFDAGAALGTVQLEVVKPAIKQLVVSVRAADANGQVARTPKDGVLVASARAFPPEINGSRSEPYLTDAAELEIPLRVATGERLMWHLVDSTWGDSVEFNCAGTPTRFALLTPDGACVVRPDRIQFAVSRRFKTPLAVTAELWATDSNASVAGSAPRQRIVARTFFELASEARIDSIPIPLWPAARVTCKTQRLFRGALLNWAFNGNTIAIDDNAVENGQCSITIDYSYEDLACIPEPVDTVVSRPGGHCEKANSNTAAAAAAAVAAQRAWDERVELGGPQGIELVVTHGNFTTTTELLVDPHEGFYLPLPAPAAPTAGSARLGDQEAYHVSFKLKNTNRANYLETTLDEKAAGSPEDTVAIGLRPRGKFGTSYPVRASVTLPITPVTLRFPPRARDVHSSRDSDRVGFEPTRASVMLVVEYWDYQQGQNKLSIPLQFQAGMSLFRITSDPVDLSTLVGAAASFPIAGEGKAETSISVGLFWEHDLQVGQNAMIATLSVDLFKPVQTQGTK